MVVESRPGHHPSRSRVLDAPPIAPLDETARRTHPQGYGWGYPDPYPPARPQGGPPTPLPHFNLPYFLTPAMAVWAGCWSLLTVW